MKEINPEGLPQPEQGTNSTRCLRSALGGAATTFVMMEGSNLLTRYILGEGISIPPVVHFGAIMSALYSIPFSLPVAMENEQYSTAKRIRGTLLKGALYTAIPGVVLGGMLSLGVTASPQAESMVIQLAVAFLSVPASIGMIDGWQHPNTIIGPEKYRGVI